VTPANKNARWACARRLSPDPGLEQFNLQLQEANAGWVKIYQDLNPDEDKQTSGLLGRVRSPHMLLPGTGLNVIKYACDVVIARNANGERDRIAV
jgi:hypothetical protein